MVKEARTRPGGRIVWNVDVTLNDSDKTVTVPVGKTWRVLSIHGQLIASGNAGNRVLTVVISNATPTAIFPRASTAAVAATQIGGIRLYACLAPSTTVFQRYENTDYVTVAYSAPLPSEFYLEAGSTIRVYDQAAIDAAADDLAVFIHYIEYDA